MLTRVTARWRSLWLDVDRHGVEPRFICPRPLLHEISADFLLLLRRYLLSLRHFVEGQCKQINDLFLFSNLAIVRSENSSKNKALWKIRRYF